MLEFDPLCLISAVAKKCHRNTNIGNLRSGIIGRGHDLRLQYRLRWFFHVLIWSYFFSFLLITPFFFFCCLSCFPLAIRLLHPSVGQYWLAQLLPSENLLKDSDPILICSKTVRTPAIHQHHKHYFDKLIVKKLATKNLHFSKLASLGPDSTVGKWEKAKKQSAKQSVHLSARFTPPSSVIKIRRSNRNSLFLPFSSRAATLVLSVAIKTGAVWFLVVVKTYDSFLRGAE